MGAAYLRGNILADETFRLDVDTLDTQLKRDDIFQTNFDAAVGSIPGDPRPSTPDFGTHGTDVGISRVISTADMRPLRKIVARLVRRM